MPTVVIAIITGLAAAAIAAFVSGLICFRKGYDSRKKEAESAIGSAEKEAERIIEAAKTSAEGEKKIALAEAKDEIHKSRNELEKEIRDRRSEISKDERRIRQKEENLDRKTDNIDKKDEQLQRKLKTAEEKLKEAEATYDKQLTKLEEISGLTTEKAKETLLSSLENELVHEKAVKVQNYEQKMRDECEDKARALISLAIARCASDQVSETTVSVVPLPNDEMKGRIIGREGRNIRTLETLTGVDLIIDDTPEAITLSCFDPARREVARIAIERLITDGRIHPARIEEMVDKARREVEIKIKQEGERAVIETNVHGINHELVKLIGRLRFRTSYRQNVLQHSIEVARLAGVMAAELGVDATLARRAGLLHDIGKALNYEIEGTHVQIGVDVCKKYKESADVIHAIEAHHGDVEPKTVVAALVQAADALSAARPGARAENYDNYIKRLQKLEEICSAYDGVEKSFAIQAGREVRLMIQPDKMNDDKMILAAREIAKRIETEMDYPGQIKVHLIRESRAIEYAK
ncbi:MAG: ribonuclease Y [Ruminococcus sp.]|jgi:ribonuclease Y|nr:ribonuclease Y [Ruminococcus sp.]